MTHAARWAALAGLGLALGLPWGFGGPSTTVRYQPGHCYTQYDADGFAYLSCDPGMSYIDLDPGTEVPGYAHPVRALVVGCAVLLLLAFRSGSARLLLAAACCAVLGAAYDGISLAGGPLIMLAVAAVLIVATRARRAGPPAFGTGRPPSWSTPV